MKKTKNRFVGKVAGIVMAGLASGNAGCYGIDLLASPVEIQSVPDQWNGGGIPEELFSVGIHTPKNAYSVGEKFDGFYDFKFYGEPFEGVIVESTLRLGFENEYYGTLRMTFSPDRSVSQRLQAFVLSEDEWGRQYACCEDSFVEPGFYRFGVDVYSCADIERVLGVDCSDINSRSMGEIGVREYVDPLASTEKVVVVGD